MPNGCPCFLRVHSEGRNEKVQHCDTRCTLSHLRPLLTILTMRPSCSVGGASLIVVCAGSPAAARAPRPIAGRECSQSAGFGGGMKFGPVAVTNDEPGFRSNAAPAASFVLLRRSVALQGIALHRTALHGVALHHANMGLHHV